MAQKSLQGSSSLASQIKERRNALNLTIEEAALKAGVGTKTWSRYESGESIREDKCKGVCKALGWAKIPNAGEDEDTVLDLEQYKTHEAWSEYLMNLFGEPAAASFAIGSDILLDHIGEDLRDLSSMPKNTHIGQISTPFLAGDLPAQFLMEYDYNFLYILQANVKRLRAMAHSGAQIIAHSVFDELTLYLIVEESRLLLEEDDSLDDDWDEWIYNLFEDMDLITFLFSDEYLTDTHPYHFVQWMENQFFMD